VASRRAGRLKLPESATYRVRPSGVTARACGLGRALIGLPAQNSGPDADRRDGVPCLAGGEQGPAVGSHRQRVRSVPHVSLEDLAEQEQYWEFMGTSGTHSIIDVLTVIPAGNDVGAIRPLTHTAWGTQPSGLVRWLFRIAASNLTCTP